jgi:hypothetical protein
MIIILFYYGLQIGSLSLTVQTIEENIEKEVEEQCRKKTKGRLK